MKCPKCRYLSFEPEIRCKHCGFDFSLSEPGGPRPSFDELEQQDPDMPMVDLQLRSVEEDEDEADVPAPTLSRMPPPLAPPVLAAASMATPAEIPLFMRSAVTITEPLQIKNAETVAVTGSTVAVENQSTPDADVDVDVDDDLPFLRVPVAPRPLSVRRRSETNRVPAAPRTAVAFRRDQDLLDELRLTAADEVPEDKEGKEEDDVHTEAPAAKAMVSPFIAPRTVPLRAAPAPAIAHSTRGEVDAHARLKAAGVDLGLLALLNLTVIVLTLRECDLTLAQIGTLPMIPFIGFLATLSVGYLLMFNVVSEQTIGKMIFKLHVVSDSPDGHVDLAPTQKQLANRALLTVPSVLLLGLGFLPGLVGEGLAVHDRLTHTRVVRE